MSISPKDNRVVAVVGATGRQGGGLVRSIAADPDSRFTVRALTRDAGSPRAKELAGLGAEVVYLDDGDHRVATGRRVVGVEQDRPARRRYLQ